MPRISEERTKERKPAGDFLGDPVVKNPLCNVGDAALIPGWTTKPGSHNEDPACCN